MAIILQTRQKLSENSGGGELANESNFSSSTELAHNSSSDHIMSALNTGKLGHLAGSPLGQRN